MQLASYGPASYNGPFTTNNVYFPYRFVLTVVTLGQCLEPVTLFMPPSCPEDPTSRPTFTCLTLGSDLGWSITTDHNSYDFYFNSLDVVGASRLEDGFEAVLLGISNSTTRTKKLRMSALTIGDSVPHGLLTIECTNIVTSTITVQYQHSLAGTFKSPHFQICWQDSCYMFGFWPTEAPTPQYIYSLLIFASLQPHYYVWYGWAFYIAAYTNHKIPGYSCSGLGNLKGSEADSSFTY